MKLLRRKGGERDRPKFYKHYDGLGPVTTTRGYAAEFTDDEGKTVARQLAQLGFHFEIVDAQDYPRRKR